MGLAGRRMELSVIASYAEMLYKADSKVNKRPFRPSV
jgi:hypothetical protein